MGKPTVPPGSLTVSNCLGSITDAGADAERIFAAAPWVEGRTAAEWIVHHGRFPAEVVLEIARTMLVGLAELEKAGICHGDVSTASLILTDRGGVLLSLPGLRGILRPEEGYAHADLLPEAYDTLAPERIAAGTPPQTPSEIYACGCVWWHLLCGRPPLAGGDSLAKLRAAQTGEICDVRRYAPDVPAALAAAISTCTEREPRRRPESLARLAAAARPADPRRQRGVGRLSGPGRPALGSVDDDDTLRSKIEPHAILDRRHHLFFGGGSSHPVAGLASARDGRSSNHCRIGRRSANWPKHCRLC